ncbi:MAG TPA: transglutaminase-like cysteine peptidase [Devosia sp.]|nr:transglutaminase-like cysteine peptidase [Devosia sp.]
MQRIPRIVFNRPVPGEVDDVCAPVGDCRCGVGYLRGVWRGGGCGGEQRPARVSDHVSENAVRVPGGRRGTGRGHARSLATLQKVNDWVNRSIKPQNDEGADSWDANATVGDCEDYVLVKRRRLIKAGIPPSALRIAFVETRSGVGPAVLVVNTTREQYALDNLTRTIKPLKQTGYRVVSMQTANPAKWR